jgi:hypothetical protein
MAQIEDAANQARLAAIDSLRDLQRSDEFPRLSQEERQNIERELRNLERDLARPLNVR